MVKIIRILAEMINDLHDALIILFKEIAPSLTDKDLHFWIMGVFGMMFYLCVDFVFKKLAKWSIEFISLIYTMTVLIVIVFAIELQQKITNRGVMDFDDIVAGIMGFVLLFMIYLVIKGLIAGVKWLYNKRNKERSD